MIVRRFWGRKVELRFRQPNPMKIVASAPGGVNSRRVSGDVVDLGLRVDAPERTPAAHELIPLIKNEKWFFDTDLLSLAEEGGYRVKAIPVRWREDPDRRVNIRGLTRMRLTKIPKKPARS
ncbi:MAG TPA: hypothetical protein VIK32_09735 [Candidatus Limnocylindrales bacterium]